MIGITNLKIGEIKWLKKEHRKKMDLAKGSATKAVEDVKPLKADGKDSDSRKGV